MVATSAKPILKLPALVERSSFSEPPLRRSNDTIPWRVREKSLSYVSCFTTIYFIGLALDDHFVKIGQANTVRTRLKELQTGNPFELKLIAAFKGHGAWESELHRAFAAYHVRGEWFLMNARIKRLIECIDNDDQRGALEVIYEAQPGKP